MGTFQKDYLKNVRERYSLMMGFIEIVGRMQQRLPQSQVKVEGLLMHAFSMAKFHPYLSQDQKDRLSAAIDHMA